jgi:predicted nucleic acid-binding protein
MPRYFLDSSALVKLYHQESGTDRVEALFNDLENRLFVSRLALVEVVSSFARLVREDVIGAADFAQLIARLEDDVASGVLTVAALSSPRLERAASILATHGLTRNVRTLDAIHLATAEALHGRSRFAALVAGDKKLLAIAAACGLAVVEVG